MKSLKLLAIIALPVLLLGSCKENKKVSFSAPSSSSSSSSTTVEKKKDAGQEYRLITGKTYYDAESALRDVDSYISSFNSESDAWEYVENMKEIRRELKDMDQFFGKYFYSCRQYVDAASEASSRFTSSEWSIVRSIWSRQYDAKYDTLLRQAMNDIDEDSFRSYMINDAEKRCLENYENKGFAGNGYILDRYNSTEVISISTPEELDGKCGKTAYGVLRVHLEGSLKMRHRVGSVKIRIKGELGITTKGDLEYHSLDYDILERTGSLE